MAMSKRLLLWGFCIKDGIGTTLNFNKARIWFQNAYSKGSQEAAYSLGYLYLKGLGNVPQDYSKAISWFEKSNYPMAKHWLAKCYYHGYGVATNKNKAIAMLKDNPISNSEVLLAQWQYELEHPEDSEANYSLKMKDSLPPLNTAIKNKGVYGSWIGEWQLMDWSGKKIERNIPIYLEITDTSTSIANIFIRLDEQEFTGTVLVEQAELVFLDVTLTLKKRYTDDPNELALDYQLTNFNFLLEENEESEILSGTLETTIQNWLEPGPPSTLLLHREGTLVSQEAKAALALQNSHFIKVYPNPFQEELLLHYTLEEDANVLVNFYDYYAPQSPLKTKEKQQQKGERTLVLNNLADVKKGLYMVQMRVGEKQYSRIIIKN